MLIMDYLPLHSWTTKSSKLSFHYRNRKKSMHWKTLCQAWIFRLISFMPRGLNLVYRGIFILSLMTPRHVTYHAKARVNDENSTLSMIEPTYAIAFARSVAYVRLQIACVAYFSHLRKQRLVASAFRVSRYQSQHNRISLHFSTIASRSVVSPKNTFLSELLICDQLAIDSMILETAWTCVPKPNTFGLDKRL